MSRPTPFLLAPLALLLACGSESKKSNTCDLTARTGCADDLACERVDGETQGKCVDPVVIEGIVGDLMTSTPLGDARVVALDANRSPLSTVAVTAGTGDAAGRYSLRVRADRDATGAPKQSFATLRAEKQGYQTFPGGIRTALPVDLAGATHAADQHRWTVTGSLADLKLVPLATDPGAWIHGQIAKPVGGVGALVVAEPSPGGAAPETGRAAIADANGNYTIFNLATGTTYVVSGYAKGTNYQAVTSAALVQGGNAVAPITAATQAPAPLTGGLIFNNGVEPPLDVALVVASTYVPTLDRGETPPGLTASVALGESSYTFTGVPDGDYIVLGAYGADGMVRDISGGGGTAPVAVTVQGGAATATPDSFKIKPAVNLTTIDGIAVSPTPTLVTTATPAFTWTKENAYSSASTYRLTVYSALGEQVWTKDVADENQNSVTYDGPALEHGSYYQLRIVALAEAMPITGTPTVLSQTEDVLGVFTY